MKTKVLLSLPSHFSQFLLKTFTVKELSLSDFLIKGTNMAPAINYVNIQAPDYRFKMCFTLSKVNNNFLQRQKPKVLLASYLWSGKLALN
jgi:hypothetical protein